ncbi:MAG: hypothetical protein FWF96_04380, partial [Kiritimatiellaeota bacterium]|nr:hypothetical protein [Kiritimatiellota bacterium]
MKNTIPLVIAVILGLAAVFAVSRTMAKKEDRPNKTVEVLVATSDLKEEQELTEGRYKLESIPGAAYKAHQHVDAPSLPIVKGLKMARDVPKGSFILWNDLVNDTGMLSTEVGRGEWAVPVRFSDASLLDFIEAGDEIAIVMVLRTARQSTAAGGNADEKVVELFNKTSVLFPKVR